MIYAIAAIHAVLFLTLLANAVYMRRGLRRTPLASYPLVSILIPARNEEDNLNRLLPSLLAQQYPSFEVLVYDDGSEDGTWDVIQAVKDSRVQGLKGDGPQPGWVGKVHALYQASRHARGDLYLFLDADAEMMDSDALLRLVERFSALPPNSVGTGLTRLRGGGSLLVSLVPNALLSALPWPLVRFLRLRSLGALNGQCWLISADHYRQYEPHERVKNEILEDVEIGRYLKGEGLTPVLLDLKNEVAVYMYRDFAEAWHGFRKNAYLIMGGSPLAFVTLVTFFFFTYVLAPFFSLWFLLSIYILKGSTDRLGGFPVLITLMTPISYLLSPFLQLDSAFHHWTGRVSWKGRPVG